MLYSSTIFSNGRMDIVKNIYNSTIVPSTLNGPSTIEYDTAYDVIQYFTVNNINNATTSALGGRREEHTQRINRKGILKGILKSEKEDGTVTAAQWDALTADFNLSLKN